MVSSISIFSHIIYFLYFIITFLHSKYTCMLKTSFIFASLHSNQKTTSDKSTLPRGERPICLTGVYLHFNFNPRSREGSDDKTSSGIPRFPHFNPRSREGSDRDVNCNFND